MTLAYLWFNAVLYVFLGVWCTIRVDGTAQSIGYALTNGSARSEYLTVYGGLELGMAAFFALCALRPELRVAGLWFGALSYGGIALYRAATVATVAGVGWFPRAMLPLESALFLAAALLLWRTRA